MRNYEFGFVCQLFVHFFWHFAVIEIQDILINITDNINHQFIT
jgi:hypothetical protein